MAKKKKKGRKKKRKRTPKNLSLPKWYREGIEDWSVGQIFDQLSEYGLEMDEEIYKQDAKDVAEPSMVAEGWVNKISSENKPLPELEEVFFHLSALALWNPILPDRDCFELALDDLSEQIDRTDNTPGQSLSKEEVGELLDILDRFYRFIEIKAEKEEKDPGDLIDDIIEDYDIDTFDFLLDLPFDLQKQGFIDEAVLVARKFVFIDRENMTGTLSRIFVNAGRFDEALEQTGQNLKEFPNDLWITIKAGDVYKDCGSVEKAEELYTKAAEIADDEYEKMDAYERLIFLYEQNGSMDKADIFRDKMDLETEEEFPDDITPISSPKIGRNEPCPCGSGLKYKKCCLNKT